MTDKDQLSKYLDSHGLIIIKSTFYSSFHGSFGIITVQSKYNNEVKHYMWSIEWFVQERDQLHVLQNGAKFYPETFSEFII